MASDRRRRERRGRRAETIAVARRGRAIVFVEVKARTSRADAAASIQPRQMSRIARAAAQYLSGRADLAGLDQRFDAVLIVRGAWPQHIIRNI